MLGGCSKPAQQEGLIPPSGELIENEPAGEEEQRDPCAPRREVEGRRVRSPRIAQKVPLHREEDGQAEPSFRELPFLCGTFLTF